ncbi:hypothetical protein D3Y57_00050 (plasmid) [Sphingomonas paeninsulae]|uniref:Uncharacterized protein n=1 Tax=Sphingomonas paeninsulae TaxID=2319844 RepID=A0A494T6R5_SPHPE|nr:hypothetical protein D3Y57_00050 [Sphingomonas paeninsulae]
MARFSWFAVVLGRADAELVSRVGMSLRLAAEGIVSVLLVSGRIVPAWANADPLELARMAANNRAFIDMLGFLPLPAQQEASCPSH